jgi:DNA-binding NarL/FixJ family response regulator
MAYLALVVAAPGAGCDAVRASLRLAQPGGRLRLVPPSELARVNVVDHARLIVLDLDAAGTAGLRAAHSLAQRLGGVPVVVTSAASDEQSIATAMHDGALSYLPKRYSVHQSALVLQLALDGVGHRPAMPAAASNNASAPLQFSLPHATSKPLLTPKQVDVLALAVDGLSNRRIAAHLEITVGTVKQHMAAIFKRLDVGTRAELIARARRMEEIRSRKIARGEDDLAALDWLLPHATHQHFRKGEVIFHKGDAGRHLFYLQRGCVLLEEIGVELREGSVFGEIAVFAPNHRRTCSARCTTAVDLFQIGAEQVKDIYYLNPEFGFHMVTLIARRLLADRERTG